MPENKQNSAGHPAPRPAIGPSHELEWLEGDVPRSRLFHDTYYSSHGGLAETGHVFIGWTGIRQRWGCGLDCTIAKLGFGAGLNFLETVRQWRAQRQGEARLNYVSFEAYPMSRDDLARTLAPWPELSQLAPRLIEAWEPEVATMDLEFVPGARLSVHFSDANTCLPKLELLADAWFLDGFAPARNPQMWSENLMREVFAHTAPVGAFATYTAAGWVRRNLEKAGFSVSREKGFAGKREMLRGVRPA